MKSVTIVLIKDLIETNIHQRGDVGGSAKKVGLRIKELERLYGIHQGNGSNQYEQKPNNSVIANSQEQLASQMGISVDTLQNYKLLAEMIPELEEVMEWMLDVQLGRRNLSPIQRIAIAEKYRSIYEKQAKENQLSGLKQNQNETVLPNLVKRESVDTTKKLAEVAGVGKETYRMAMDF